MLSVFSFALLLFAGTPRPALPPATLLEYLGEYGTTTNRVIIRESNGGLEWIEGKGAPKKLEPAGKDHFRVAGKEIHFVRTTTGRVKSLNSNTVRERRTDFPEDGAVFKIQPVRPVEELRNEASRHLPPVEKNRPRKADLVDLTTLPQPIQLDIRYATTNNFIGAAMYSQTRAFLQRPAAEALGRAAEDLKAQGFGLLIHDAYRPWYVTWMFWEATPTKQRMFVANPTEGSKHNRGCAVDLSMYDLKTGKPVNMVSVYDEMTGRAYPDYPGGTSLARWQRSVLRQAMEKQGFAVNVAEWWHFDYADWKLYPIGTAKFEDLR